MCVLGEFLSCYTLKLYQQSLKIDLNRFLNKKYSTFNLYLACSNQDRTFFIRKTGLHRVLKDIGIKKKFFSFLHCNVFFMKLTLLNLNYIISVRIHN